MKKKNTHTATWMAYGISFGLIFGLGIGSSLEEKEKRDTKGRED